MKKINFDIRPFRSGWMHGARIVFYVVDKYNANRYQTFACIIPMREFHSPEQFENELYRNSKNIFNKLRELCYTLERWEELSDELYQLDMNEGVKIYPKPLDYYITNRI